ncbi:sensor histidine kinase [Gemmatimonas sp.]|uniref:sensor histidine kinase n=1 Tax=Gemmatimonas sp. TaxID=1962908 RepID=UPI00286EB1AA|nr:sensor histidine kinase [Gemmatimonas sp.]
MRLADFIDANIDPILDEWVTFARKQAGSDGMDLDTLRDHASDMLRTIAKDLRTPQTSAEQVVKSQGEAPPDASPTESAAQSHGTGRARDGFTVGEMMAEFRALRASVLRLWTESRGDLARADLQDLMRFNEAIDQAMVESVATYTGAVDQSHDLFVAILGHDLRTPLHMITLVAEHVLDAKLVDAPHLPLIARAMRSARRMGHMLDDLLDFTRSRMGTSIAITPRQINLATVVGDAVDEMRSASPHHVFDVQLTGDLRGKFDGVRLSQALINLIGNAVQHGAASAPVTVTARGEADHVVIEVRNVGPTIDPQDISGLFSPFKRLRRGVQASDAHHLGLGLFIADQLVLAHGGRLEVTSNAEQGTCFAVHLPRVVKGK